MKKIFFLGGGCDYQAMDWFRAIKDVCFNSKVTLITDSISNQGYDSLIIDSDDFIELFNIDKFLFANQSKYGNLWRNIIKLSVLPIQVTRLKNIANNNPDAVFHAHTIYYMFLCWLAGICYIGRPQASEILKRTDQSKLYRYFAIKSILNANHVIVDSKSMQKKIFDLCRKKSTFIQNWLDIDLINQVVIRNEVRDRVVSIRGFTELYRIEEILDARDFSSQKSKLVLIYPLLEDTYKSRVSTKLKGEDTDLGRLNRDEMYQLFNDTKLVVSIPSSDSSPRSVYESIFCGCCVAVTYNAWIESLPDCMRKRLYIVDIKDPAWLDKALCHADLIVKAPYEPSEEALNIFDRQRTIKYIEKHLYQCKREN